MKRALFLIVAVSILAGLSGCAQQPIAPDGGDPCVQGCSRTACCWPPCSACAGSCRDAFGRGAGAMQPQEPPMEAVTYPYYTLRGPRDFLERTPTPIGP